MYQILLRMYQGSESAVQSAESVVWITYGFLKEIVDHPCWNGGLRICRIICTKFNEGCTKFCEGCTKFCKGCTKRANVYSEVRNDLQSLLEGPQRIIWTMGREIRVSIAGGFDVPKFLNDAPNLLKDIPRVPKFVLE